MNGESFYIGLGITASLLLIEHWFPWPVRLPRYVAYPLGVGAILAGFLYWRLKLGDIESATGLMAFCAVAGIAVYGAYGIDALVRWIRKALKALRTMENDLTSK